MNRRITDWLRTESLPRNLYELLGHPLLDADRDALLLTLRTANRDVLDYQSHPEPTVSKRAIFLLTELGRYRGILEDDAKYQVHVEETAQKLRDQFVAERGPLALHAGNDLPTWLSAAAAASPADADRIAAIVRGNVPPAQTLPKRGNSKFGAFGASAPPEPVAAEIVEIIEPPPPTPVVVGVYDLSDAPPMPAPRPKRKPDRMVPVDPAPRKRSKSREPSESSLAVPLAVAGGVLMLLAIVTAVVIVMTSDSDKVVQTDPPPQTPLAPTEPESPPADPPLLPPSGKTDPKKPEEVKKVDTKAEAARKEQQRFENERKENERKKREMDRIERERMEKERMEKERMEKERMEKERMEKERMEKERMEKERMEKDRKDEEGNPWATVADGKEAFMVKDLRARVHSVSLQNLTDLEKKVVDGLMLVIWVEVVNRGTTVRRYRRLIDYQNKMDDYFQYCTLRDDSQTSDKQIKRAYWLNLDRKQIRELPDWYEDESANRIIEPNKKVLIPVVFENPKTTGKDFTLTINAIRIAGEKGSGTEYGRYVLRIREQHWKK